MVLEDLSQFVSTFSSQIVLHFSSILLNSEDFEMEDAQAIGMQKKPLTSSCLFGFLPIIRLHLIIKQPCLAESSLWSYETQLQKKQGVWLLFSLEQLQIPDILGSQPLDLLENWRWARSAKLSPEPNPSLSVGAVDKTCPHNLIVSVFLQRNVEKTLASEDVTCW